MSDEVYDLSGIESEREFHWCFGVHLSVVRSHLQEEMTVKRRDGRPFCVIVKTGFDWRRYGAILGMQYRYSVIRNPAVMRNVLWVLEGSFEGRIFTKFTFLEGLV